MSFINKYAALVARKQAERSSKRIFRMDRKGQFDHPNYEKEERKLLVALSVWADATGAKKLKLS